MFDDNIAPIPKPDVDFSSLSAQPTPEQYFLLSRINGELTVAELCRVSGLTKDETLAELEQLADYGLIEIPGATADDDGGASSEAESSEPAEAAGAAAVVDEPEESTAESQPEPDESDEDDVGAGFVLGEASSSEDASVQTGSQSSPVDNRAPDAAFVSEDDDENAEAAADSQSTRAAEQHEAKNEKDQKEKDKKDKKKRRDVTPNYPVPPADFEYDQALISLDIPLDEQQRREALCLYEQLDQMTFYDLFGVDSDASRRDIKRAYFRLSKRYHPDKFFRKELHDFSEILERIFQEITKAYRTLSKSDKRDDYDQTLQSSAAAGQSDAPSPAAASSLAENSSRAFQDEENEKKKHEKNKRDAAALLLIRRAEKLVERDQYERAAGEYRKALAIKREPSMAIDVARMMDEEGDRPEDAISFARAALKLDPRNIEARMLLSDLYDKTGRTDDALNHLEKAARLAPSNEDVQRKLEAMRANDQG